MSVAVITLKGIYGLVLEKAGLSERVVVDILLLGRLLEGEGGLGKDAGGASPWGL